MIQGRNKMSTTRKLNNREKRPKYSAPLRPEKDESSIRLKLQSSLKLQEKNILAQLNNYNNVFMQKVISPMFISDVRNPCFF